MAEAQARIVPLQPMQALSMDDRNKVLPAYTVTPLSRKMIVNKAVKDELGFRSVPEERVVDGFMVRTLRGDSIFVLQEDIIRMKLDRNLVPMVVEGGDDTPVAMQQVGAALSDQQKLALAAVEQLLARDPNIVA